MPNPIPSDRVYGTFVIHARTRDGSTRMERRVKGKFNFRGEAAKDFPDSAARLVRGIILDAELDPSTDRLQITITRR